MHCLRIDQNVLIVAHRLLKSHVVAAGAELRWVGCEMDTEEIRHKIGNILVSAEKYAWVYHIVVLVVIGGLRFGLITAQGAFIDIILAVTIISLSAQAINKLRNRSDTEMPVLVCIKCKNNIEPAGEWICKKCGWKSVFPDDTTNTN